MRPRLKFRIAPAGKTSASPSESSKTSEGEAGERVRGEVDEEEAELAIGVDGELANFPGAAWLIRVATNAAEDTEDEVEGTSDPGDDAAAPAKPPTGESPTWPPSP